MGVVDKVKTVVSKLTKKSGSYEVYDMSTKESRQIQVKRDFEHAKTEKEPITQKFVELNRYYNNQHYSKDQMLEINAKYGWDFIPPTLPDPFIQVESQIDNTIPAFQFKGRDDDLDSARAKIREAVVNFIMYNNKVEELNLDNERCLNELGTALWKVSFDGSISGPGFVGDIVIGNPDPANIFPDPSAYSIDECEFIIYAFRMHRRKAKRIFGKVVEELIADGMHRDTEIYDSAKKVTIDDNTVQVVEYWYRDDEGDIACSICINDIEVKHIPKYWQNTRHSGNKMFPFIKYGKIPVRKSFWDKGEIEPIIDLVDAANRELFTALLNDMFMANDITIVEEGALAEGQEMQNVPGAVVHTKANRSAGIKRLGGVSQNANIFNMIKFIHEKIQETTGNYVSQMGKEPVRVTTASGIAQLNERADARKTVKGAGRLEGFAQLAELIDWTALEFYNTDRIILIRGEKEGEPDTTITYNSDRIRVMDNQTEPGGEPQYYYPKVDVEINAGEGIKKSKSFTLAATSELAGMNITPANAPIVKSIVDLLDLPNKDEIMQAIDMAMQPPQVPLGADMGGQDEQFKAAFAKLTPEEQEIFASANQQTQLGIMEQLMGGGMG